MKKDIKSKSIIIIGASGGLGSGIAKELSKKGTKLLLAGRKEHKLSKLAEQIKGNISYTSVDITNKESVENFISQVKEWSDQVDFVVNVTGYDARKSIEAHSEDDIANSINTNLYGSIKITKAILPLMRNEKGSMLIHIGGFADGRLAFPYYSVDSATRAGVFTFAEAMNRELKLKKSNAKIAYFCPSPSDTEAERPYHALWKQMGIKIIPVEKVAQELIKMMEKNKTVKIMGGFLTVFFAKLNSISPGLADIIMMKHYGRLLQNYLEKGAGDAL